MLRRFILGYFDKDEQYVTRRLTTEGLSQPHLMPVDQYARKKTGNQKYSIDVFEQREGDDVGTALVSEFSIITRTEKGPDVNHTAEAFVEQVIASSGEARAAFFEHLCVNIDNTIERSTTVH